MTATGVSPTTLDLRSGYSEQTAPSSRNNSYTGRYGTVAITRSITHTLGSPNDVKDTRWDYLPFHDRDFHSVAKLALVPGCPPGLFIKRFVENVPDNDNDDTTAPWIDFEATGQPDAGDYFFYEYDPAKLGDMSTLPTTRPSNALSVSTTTPPRVSSVTGQPFEDGDQNVPRPPYPKAYPYLVDKFFYSAALSAPLGSGIANSLISSGDPDGWHAMFELFEVPSTMAGATGEVAYGNNSDWVRQDRRPGQINLNLIFDEEVFFGLCDDPRLALLPAGSPMPQVVTQVDALGNLTSYPMPDRGFAVLPPLPTTATGKMKSAFADFLRLRHGG